MGRMSSSTATMLRDSPARLPSRPSRPVWQIFYQQGHNTHTHGETKARCYVTKGPWVELQREGTDPSCWRPLGLCSAGIGQVRSWTVGLTWEVRGVCYQVLYWSKTGPNFKFFRRTVTEGRVAGHTTRPT